MTVDYTKLSVEEIRNLIVRDSKGSFTLEAINQVKGKTKLVDLHKMVEQTYGIDEEEEEESENEIESLFDEDDAEQITPRVAETKSAIPAYSSSEWSDWILTQFQDNELVGEKKCPNIDGLRRVTELVLGDIVESRPVDVRVFRNDSQDLGHATVVYAVKILWKLGMPAYIEHESDFVTKTFCGLAGANIHNTDADYAIFPEAIAESRAEARALRKALRLNKVSAEEIVTGETIERAKQTMMVVQDIEWNEEDPISPNQINTINIMCNRLNIDLAKFIKTNGWNYDNLEQATKKVAQEMVTQLNKYQTNTQKSISIPSEILKENVE